MDTNAMRRATVVAGCAWAGVAVYGISDVMTESGDDWRVGYALFNLALLLGVVCTVLVVAGASRQGSRPRLRLAGLVASGLGCALAAMVAWALPVWMTLLGTGFALVAVATGSVRGRLLALLAAAQVVAIGVLIVGIEAELGAADEYGDYPAAAGIALVVVAVITVTALVALYRDANHVSPAQPQAAADVRALRAS